MSSGNRSLYDKKQRFDKIQELYAMEQFKNFKGNFWIIGGGSIGSILIFLLQNVFSNKNKITVFDKDANVQKKIIDNYGDVINFVNVHIKKNNYISVFKDIKKDDVLIDCSYCLFTCDIFDFCNEIGCSYINSSIEDWCFSTEPDNSINETLMRRCIEIEKHGKNAETIKTNFIVSMGCNPGNVSIWTKLALHLINKYDGNFEYQTFGELAYKLGVNVIHISEKDTQKTNKPKRENEYCNTWSGTAESMYEEACAFAEGSWGTHEKNVPNDIVFRPEEYDNYIALKRRGMSTFLMSYTPLSKNYIGMMIRHDESFTIGRELSYYENGKLLYKPSVYYVYHPTDSTMMSFYELRERNMKYQETKRLLTDDIIEGVDELGLSLFLNNGKIYWIGSLLNIHEAREIFGNKHNGIINATGLQVAAGYLAGIMHIVDLINDNEYKGVMCPDDLPYQKILKYSLPFFGDFVINSVTDWNYNEKYNNEAFDDTIEIKNKWQFEDFLIKF